MENSGLFGRHFGQKLGQKIGKNIGRKGQKVGQKVDEKVEQISSTALSAAQAAKATLDQILLSLEEKGIKLKDSQDMLQRIGQSVLDRAESIREQVAQNPLSPSWVKEVTFTKAHSEVVSDTVITDEDEVSTSSAAQTSAGKKTAKKSKSAQMNLHDSMNRSEASGSIAEATISQAAQDMQPAPLKSIMEEGLTKEAAQSMSGSDGADTDSDDDITMVKAAPGGKKAKAKKKTTKSKAK